LEFVLFRDSSFRFSDAKAQFYWNEIAEGGDGFKDGKRNSLFSSASNTTAASNTVERAVS
jgi:hypothetical protein